MAEVIDCLEWVGFQVARPMPPEDDSPTSPLRIRESESLWHLVTQEQVNSSTTYTIKTILEMIIALFDKNEVDYNVRFVTMCVEEMLTNILRYGFANFPDSNSHTTDETERYPHEYLDRAFEGVDPRAFTIRVTIERIKHRTSQKIRLIIEAGDQGPDLRMSPAKIIAASAAAALAAAAPAEGDEQSAESRDALTSLPCKGRGMTYIVKLGKFKVIQIRNVNDRKVMRFSTVVAPKSVANSPA